MLPQFEAFVRSEELRGKAVPEGLARWVAACALSRALCMLSGLAMVAHELRVPWELSCWACLKSQATYAAMQALNIAMCAEFVALYVRSKLRGRTQLELPL